MLKSSLSSCVKECFKYAVVKKCEESNCKLMTGGVERHVVLKGERLTANRDMANKLPGGLRICDCPFFIDRKLYPAILVELKSKTIRRAEVEQKLVNGLRLVLSVLEETLPSLKAGISQAVQPADQEDRPGSRRGGPMFGLR